VTATVTTIAKHAPGQPDQRHPHHPGDVALHRSVDLSGGEEQREQRCGHHDHRPVGRRRPAREPFGADIGFGGIPEEPEDGDRQRHHGLEHPSDHRGEHALELVEERVADGAEHGVAGHADKVAAGAQQPERVGEANGDDHGVAPVRTNPSSCAPR
jgi:hypothetical protein